jgi:Spy/CpxP family protein refolding chaperone
MKVLAATLAFASLSAAAAPAKNDAPPRPRWLLGTFLKMSRENPARLLNLSERLFSDERLRQSSNDAQLAFEWQHRLAAAGALSDLFDPEAERALGAKKAAYRQRAREAIVRAMTLDPSLLVRDGAVEAVRRVFRMQPGEGKLWKASLEKAFLDPRNLVQGEGLFIRETILTALREASLPLTPKIRKAAKADQNPTVRRLLQQWSTSAYSDL